MPDQVGEHLHMIRQGLARDLPGHDGFLRHTSYRRELIDEALKKEPSPRYSAVLIVLFPVGGITHTVLIKRPEYEGVHSGQIAFPGGRMEPQDRDLEQTARREFTEETGARTDKFEILGTLSPLYIPPSRSLVTPFIASAPERLEFNPDDHEVQSLLHPSFDEILAPGLLSFTERFVSTTQIKSAVPYFGIQGEVVWGATAMMIAELREVCGVGLQ
jgi:8-oxo-dGTP pyrophosphatase MutT (NUDIX family)